jgi:glycosyltransferase involved in cell wall biosynthesis
MTMVSVIIGTRNRAARLQATIRHLGATVAEAPWELLLVDNGSTDETPAVCAGAQEYVAAPVTALREPRRGVSSAKNLGAAHARGDVLLFIDDDCYAAPDLVQRVADRFTHHDIGFLGGRVLLHDPLDLPLTIRTDTEEEWFPRGRFMPAGAIHGACLAFRRSALERVGLYDPLLGPGTPCGSGEDSELIGRCVLAGWDGVYAPEAVVRHHHGRRTDAESYALYVAYSHGRGGCYAALMLRGYSWIEVMRVWQAGTKGRWRWYGRKELEGSWRYLAGLAHSRRVLPHAPTLRPAQATRSGEG